ncbi:MAG: LysR family transcriptional regulator [bacterium]|nr:LysR family transcriptional regulator [bacterium]
MARRTGRAPEIETESGSPRSAANSIRELEWDDLRYFLAVADSGSFNQAALVLGVSYSTVTRRVNALEDRIGVRLFDRNRGGHDLTAAAEEMANVARRMDGEIRSLARQLSGRDQRMSGRIRVAIAEMLALTYMQDLAAFRHEYPEIEVDLVAASEHADLACLEVDIALRAGNHPPDELVGRRLEMLPVAIYASEEYLARRPADLELAAHTWISPNGGFTQLASHAWMLKHAQDAHVAMRVHSGTTLLAAVREGIGIAHLFCAMGDAQPELRQIRPPEPELETALWILTHDDLRTTPRIRAFLDFMAKRIRLRSGQMKPILFQGGKK